MNSMILDENKQCIHKLCWVCNNIVYVENETTLDGVFHCSACRKVYCKKHGENKKCCDRLISYVEIK